MLYENEYNYSYFSNYEYTKHIYLQTLDTKIKNSNYDNNK